MQVLLTFDYELFFGADTGSVENCMTGPGNRLLALCRKYGIPMTFFLDVGYLLKLEAAVQQFPHLTSDLEQIKLQVAEMVELGCDVQLHIHPHWEQSHYDGRKWHIVTENGYKLDDFTDAQITDIVTRYYHYLAALTRKPVHTFRAGGWCVQPFARLQHIFAELGIRIDSSVFPGGEFHSADYAFDFTDVPRFSPAYHFEDDVCVAVENGRFLEIPIASWHYSPLFYWRLYTLGRLFPARHKMLGDGSFLAQPGRKQSVLTSYTWNHVSADGYYAGKLAQQARVYDRKGLEHFVVIGHPKGLTLYALERLEAFIRAGRNKYVFTTFSDNV